jgi:hypothetical protein
VAVGSEPTSVAHLGNLLLAAVTSASFTDPSAQLVVLDARTLTGLAEVAPGDPEPEYVSINSRD